MPLFTEVALRETAKGVVRSRASNSAKSVLVEARKAVDLDREFDIFLLHVHVDADLILGLVTQIEDMGFSVYLDWQDDAQLSRSNVNRHTSDLLRARMQKCKCLFFATSPNSQESNWMPRGCDYLDSVNGKVAVCPIVECGGQIAYRGQECLGRYPYVMKVPLPSENEPTLWIHESPTKCMILGMWLEGLPTIEWGR